MKIKIALKQLYLAREPCFDTSVLYLTRRDFSSFLHNQRTLCIAIQRADQDKSVISMQIRETDYSIRKKALSFTGSLA